MALSLSPSRCASLMGVARKKRHSFLTLTYTEKSAMGFLSESSSSYRLFSSLRNFSFPENDWWSQVLKTAYPSLDRGPAVVYRHVWGFFSSSFALFFFKSLLGAFYQWHPRTCLAFLPTKSHRLGPGQNSRCIGISTRSACEQKLYLYCHCHRNKLVRGGLYSGH